MSAAYAIYDESSAIQSVADSVDIAALQNSSAIYLTNVGTVELKVGGYNSIGSKFDDTSDVVVRDSAPLYPQY